MSLDLSKLRARVDARTRQHNRPKGRPTKAPLPDPVIKRQEEQRALFEAAEARRVARLTKWTNEHTEVAAYLRMLTREFTETRVEEPGLVDLDLHYAVRGLRLDRLPYAVRHALLAETHQWIKRVHRRNTRSADITPYARLFDPAFVDSLSETRTALKLH